ncbi:trypsin-like peptidase domain-containing protein [Planctomicrobium sp. SH527]|uniref:trypsin-like peptidase domain-containing protein n=1 Tax=Planctomicrobium sp. SH527 TaxID=3448123 RepID=UPI003F5BEC54
MKRGTMLARSCCVYGLMVLTTGGGTSAVFADPVAPFTEPAAEYAPPAASVVATSSSVADTLRLAGRHLAAISAKTMPAVVNIESSRDSRSGEVQETGSGVIMRSPRTPGVFVITNRHVVADARLEQIEIYLHDGRVLTPTGKVEDAASDLAVLRITDPGIPVAQFADSDNLDIGHFVLAMGSPFGLSQSVTLGIISAKGRRSLELPGRNVVNQDFLQTDAAINPGNSGGPLVDLDGRVVGINTAIASQGGGNEGIGFSIPSNLVQFIVDQLLENGRVRRGYLGVQLDDQFDFAVAKSYSLDRKQGARVTKVLESTPAALAGIRPDDIILNFDGFDVADQNDLVNKVNVTQLDKRVRVIVLRGGQKMTLHVVLSEKQDGERSEAPIPDELLKPTYRNTGLSLIKLDDSLAVQSGFAAGQQGLLVKALRSDSVQNGAGSNDEDSLQLYDVIEEVARRPVISIEDLDAALAAQDTEPSVLLKVRRVIEGKVQSRLVVWHRR